MDGKTPGLPGKPATEDFPPEIEREVLALLDVLGRLGGEAGGRPDRALVRRRPGRRTLR